MKRLRELRESRGFTQTELGRRARIAPQVISQIEHGWRKSWPKLSKRLARALKVNPEELFEETDSSGQ